VYQEKLRAQELQAHKARTKGKALYTDGEFKAVMLDILEDPQHNVRAAVRSFNSLYKEHDPHRIPRGTASDWWQKVKPYLSTKKNYLGELKQTRARAFIADNVRCDGDTGANMRVLSDAEENVRLQQGIHGSVEVFHEGGERRDRQEDVQCLHSRVGSYRAAPIQQGALWLVGGDY
jgi:hypothetical protein